MTMIPMRLLRIPQPFDHPEWIWEPKFDGFRALAVIDGHRCTLLSRNGHVFKSWPQLAEEIAHGVRCCHAVLDGEICCLDPDGRSNFRDLLFRREWPYFIAFDLLALERRDLRGRPLADRKRQLARVMPRVAGRVFHMEHVQTRGIDLFRTACDHDVEGIVGKWLPGSYSLDARTTSWVKVKNPSYSQMDGRRELFESRRRAQTRAQTRSAVALVLR